MVTDETNMGNQPTGGALSIYGQNDAAMDDFPVLKAFQQYIDAEQSKSRKRMIMLCMFFGVLMTIVVAVFVLMLGQMNRDKQQVNDQLIQFLMKERDRAPTTVQPVVQPVANPAQDAALKAMTETLSTLQRQMADQKKAAAEEAAAKPTKAELERARLAEQESLKLRRAQEKLEAEKRALADEKERLRQAEIERQRRRLYPDYYQKQESVLTPSQTRVAPPSQPQAETPSPVPTVRRRELTDADIDDILREVDALQKDEDEELLTTPKKKRPAKAKSTSKRKKAKAKADDEDADDEETTADKPIQYFDDTEYALPVKVNGEDASWSFSLE